jgi:hypothetical protein
MDIGFDLRKQHWNKIKDPNPFRKWAGEGRNDEHRVGTGLENWPYQAVSSWYAQIEGGGGEEKHQMATKNLPRLPNGYQKPNQAAKWLPKIYRGCQWLPKTYQGCQMATENLPRQSNGYQILPRLPNGCQKPTEWLSNGYQEPTKAAIWLPNGYQKSIKAANWLPKTYQGCQMAAT